MKRVFWMIGMMSWATATGWAQCYVSEPTRGRIRDSSFPAVKGFTKGSRYDLIRAFIRLTHGTNYCVGEVSIDRAAVLCAQLKDSTRNGGLDAQGLNHHALHDDKLKWGWAPGPGRTPAPYSWGSFHVAMADWLIYGATCPPIRLERRPAAPRPPA